MSDPAPQTVHTVPSCESPPGSPTLPISVPVPPGRGVGVRVGVIVQHTVGGGLVRVGVEVFVGVRVNVGVGVNVRVGVAVCAKRGKAPHKSARAKPLRSRVFMEWASESS